MRLVAAPTRACTGRRLTFQRRLVTLWAWLMRFPNCGFLPQISHCCAMTAVDPFRGLDGNFYSTGFRVFGTIRTGWGGKNDVSPTDRVIYTVSRATINYIPMLMGAFLFLSACVGYGKPPVKWHIRLIVGGLGCLLLFLGLRQLIFSK